MTYYNPYADGVLATSERDPLTVADRAVREGGDFVGGAVEELTRHLSGATVVRRTVFVDQASVDPDLQAGPAANTTYPSRVYTSNDWMQAAA